MLAEKQHPRSVRERPIPQPVHQRIRFLVERGIRTRIPPSVRNFPRARAVPGATIYANLQTRYSTTRVQKRDEGSGRLAALRPVYERPRFCSPYMVRSFALDSTILAMTWAFGRAA